MYASTKSQYLHNHTSIRALISRLLSELISHMFQRKGRADFWMTPESQVAGVLHTYEMLQGEHFYRMSEMRTVWLCFVSVI